MNMNPVGWFEIYVHDMPRAKAFYERVLGRALTLLPTEGMEGPSIEMYAFAMSEEPLPGASGALVKMEGFAPNGNGILVYFSCEDCAVEAGRVEAAGGRIQQQKISIGPYGFCALAVDTEGNMFGLHSMH
ncbi:MAG: VOC family protein [Lysobacter sp.]|nr:VOC family protein [Lysobacter sp.]